MKLLSTAILFVTVLLASAQNITLDNYTGTYTDAASWEGTTDPNSYTFTQDSIWALDEQIVIRGYITHGNSFYDNSKKTPEFRVRDTLVIAGNMTFTPNSHTLIVESGGLLVVFGNYESGAKVDVQNGGTIVIKGNATFPSGGGASGGYTGGIGASFYVDGTVTGDAAAAAAQEPTTNLDGGTQGEQDLFDFINSNDPVNVPLPVELVEFKTENSAFEVDLIWSTASEENTSHFELYKSYNGQEFFYLDQVPAVGFSSSLQTYQYKDTNPSEGFNFYKLVSVDYDGYTEVFEVILNDFHFAGLQPYPNPFDGQKLSLSSFEAIGELDVMVTDLMGRVILQKELKDDDYAIEFAQPLKKGFYMLKVRNERSNYNYSTRLIVK